MTDTAQPFDAALPGESDRAYAAFCVYRDYGPERSISKARQEYKAQHPRSRPYQNTWEGWSSKYSWVARSQTYDQHMDSVALEERERLWKERQGEIAEREYEIGMALLSKAEDILAAPVYQKRVEGEGKDKVTIIEPVKFRMNDAQRLARTGADLGRRASGLPTQISKSEIDVSRLMEKEIAKAQADLDEHIRTGRVTFDFVAEKYGNDYAVAAWERNGLTLSIPPTNE